ncbi:Protein Dopey-1 [Manis pentadactyla]|nr:Protein Dopey-1 [Manis pentadactyla]
MPAGWSRDARPGAAQLDARCSHLTVRRPSQLRRPLRAWLRPPQGRFRLLHELLAS